jgi:hypothetical protein
VLALTGAVLWPVGEFGFGGFGEDAGTAIIAAGCVLVLASLTAEFVLRARTRRARTNRSAR